MSNIVFIDNSSIVKWWQAGGVWALDIYAKAFDALGVQPKITDFVYRNETQRLFSSTRSNVEVWAAKIGAITPDLHKQSQFTGFGVPEYPAKSYVPGVKNIGDYSVLQVHFRVRLRMLKDGRSCAV